MFVRVQNVVGEGARHERPMHDIFRVVTADRFEEVKK